MTNPSFEQGQSTSEREAFPAGPAFDQMHTRREYVGLGQLARDTRTQPHMQNELVRASQNLSMPQMQHGLIQEARGMPGKETYPSGTPPTNGLHGATRSPSPSGRIKAVQRYGLGPAYARPGPQDDTHADVPGNDYLANPEGPLDKYVGAKSVLGPGQDYGSGYPAEHQLSAFPTMGDDIINGLNYGRGQR